jgi:hypothetical protein
LTGKSDDIEQLSSVRQVNELLAQMRNIFRKLQQDSQHLLAHDETINSEKGGSDEAEFKRRQTIA